FPVRIVERAGQQMGVGPAALVKVRPRSATSSFVRGMASQTGLTASRSSARTITMFGAPATGSGRSMSSVGPGGATVAVQAAAISAVAITAPTALEIHLRRRGDVERCVTSLPGRAAPQGVTGLQRIIPPVLVM